MAAEQPEPYKGWLDDFDREVDRVLHQPTAPSLTPVRKAVSDFNDWWNEKIPSTDTGEDFSVEARQANQELEISRREVRALKDQIERLKSLPDIKEIGSMRDRLDSLTTERDKLQQDLTSKSAQLDRESLESQGKNTELERQCGELQLKLSKERDAHDARIRQLEERAIHLNDQLGDAKKNLEFLTSEHAKQGDRLERAEGTLREELSDRERLRNELHEMVRKLDRLQHQLNDKDSERTALEFTIVELRRQATDLRERMIKSTHTLDANRNSDREELLKISQRSEDMEKRLAAGNQESEAKVRETTRYLEMKIREIHDENKEQFGSFRELLDALVRFRGGPR